MTQANRSTSHRRRVGRAYTRRVLRTAPIGYWPLTEHMGSVAYCWADTARNGTLSRAVTAMGTALGPIDGKSAPVFNGASDLANIYSASLAAAFSPTEGTLALWARPAAGLWTTGALNVVARLAANASNGLSIAAPATNNRLTFTYTAAGTSETIDVDGQSWTGWKHLALTWSKSAPPAGQVKAYIAGSQAGTTQTNLGTWAGALATNACCIAALGTATLLPWSGQLAHVALWARALAPAKIAALARV